MCNLYSLTKGQQAIRESTGAMRDRTGNLPPMPSIFPDYLAPVVRNDDGKRELTMMRWGMPCPPQFGGPPVHERPEHQEPALEKAASETSSLSFWIATWSDDRAKGQERLPISR